MRPEASRRKTKLHFGSDLGVEMSTVYRSVISTLRMRELSVWDFFRQFFSDVVEHGADTLEFLQQPAG